LLHSTLLYADSKYSQRVHAIDVLLERGGQKLYASGS